MLCIVDRFTRECLFTELDTSLTGHRAVAVLNLLVAMRVKPEMIRVDSGPEIISQALDAWAFENGVKLHFIRPGKPIENAHVESFNGRLRDECPISNGSWISRTRGRRSNSGDATTARSGRTAH